MKTITRAAGVCWLSFAAAGGLLGSPDANATTTPWSGTQRVQVTDPKYGITAMSFEIPAGWKFAGSIVRPVGCHSRGANASYTAQSPDGITTLVALPGVTWSWTTSLEMLKDFKNPATGQTIEASNQYNHQWLSSDGSTLIQTQDHNFDPNGQVYPGSQSWTELVPK